MEENTDITLRELSRSERMRLMRFVCSFAWADLEIADGEREFVADLVRRLHLDEDERAQVEEWLEVPPDPEEIDPTDVPREHRQIFLRTILGMVMADGHVDTAEVESFSLFEQLLT